MRLLLSRDNLKSSKRRIWRSVIKNVNRRGKKVEVNLTKLNRVAAKKGALVVVPGKVLGSGMLERPITIGALAFSETAKRKIASSGSKIMSIDDFISAYPSGKEVIIVGS